MERRVAWMRKSILVVMAVLSVGLAGAGQVVSGKAAVAKFPAELRAMGLRSAKWMRLTDGVDYYYGRFTNLVGTVEGFTGTKNDLHMLRIDYKKAKLRMKFVDHTQESSKRWATSQTAAAENALFAVNMTMEDGKKRPHGYAKANGRVIPNGAELSNSGVKGGFAFNDDKSFRFDPNWLETDPKTGKPKADPWQNVITHEAYTVRGGKATWGANATYFSRANYPFLGVTADGVMWVCVVDGRCKDSQGLGYHEVAALQVALGCVDGVCCDGGGSTTLAIRKDLMTVSDICGTQKLSAHSDRYYTMNYLSDALRTERKVINQLLFLRAD